MRPFIKMLRHNTSVPIALYEEHGKCYAKSCLMFRQTQESVSIYLQCEIVDATEKKAQPNVLNIKVVFLESLHMTAHIYWNSVVTYFF